MPDIKQYSKLIGDGALTGYLKEANPLIKTSLKI